MGKQPVKMRAVVYALSSFHQKIMSGLWKDLPRKISHKVSENWISAPLLLAPLVGTYTIMSESERRGTRVVFSPLRSEHKSEEQENVKRYSSLGNGSILHEDLVSQRDTPNIYVFNSLMNTNAHDLGYTLDVYKDMQLQRKSYSTT